LPKSIKPEPLGQAFNRLWTSTLSAHVADGVLATAAPLLATRLTDNPVLIAGLAAVVMLPWLLFGIPIGGLLDRVNRRMAMVVAGSVRVVAAALVALAIGAGFMNIYLLYVLAFVIGITDVVTDTAAQSMIPKMLHETHLERGNSRLQIAQTVLQTFIGAPLGGFLYAVAIWIPFAFNAAGFAIAALLILLIPMKAKADWNRASIADTAPVKGTFWKDVRFGIRYLWQDKSLLRLVVTTATIGFCFSASTATMVLYILKVQHVPEALYGLVMTIDGVAGLLGAINAPYWSKRLGRGTALAISIVGAPFFLGISGFMPNFGLFLATGMLHMYLISIWNILLMSTYHSLIPNELFGRIHGTRRTLVWGMMPLGSLLGGWLATFGLQVPFLMSAIIATAVGVSAFGFIRRLEKPTS
jgi:MFS family permease